MTLSPCTININDIASKQLPTLALLLISSQRFGRALLRLRSFALNGSALQGILASPNANKHTPALPQPRSGQIIEYFANHDISCGYLVA